MQRRQDWLRESLAQAGEPILDFVGSARIEEPVHDVATRMRESLGLERNWAQTQQTWTTALETLRHAIDAVGVVVVTNGVVGNNTHRKLDPGEFRGFVLVDQHAPLVFVNGADSKAAQMFTLVHELAHLWFGQSAVFDLRELQPSADRTETACNFVAAEFLVAEEELRAAWARVQNQGDPFNVLARQFKVSAIVAARRALDLQFIRLTDFLKFFRDHLAETARRKKTKPDGGDFYRTQNVRLGRRFAVALVLRFINSLTFSSCTNRQNMAPYPYTTRTGSVSDAASEPLSNCAVGDRETDVDRSGGEIHAPVFRGAPRQDDSAGGRGLVQ